MVLIIGAGLAGLTCARALHTAGVPVTVLEREVVPGGRVRTEQHPDGFLLDRGFQVLFTAYPSAHKHLSFSRLDLKRFVPGAILARNGKLQAIADPLRQPGYLFTTAATSMFGLGDKLRVLPLSLAARRASISSIFSEQDTTTEQYLRSKGFSTAFIDHFARPFYGGIFLDRSLATSSAMFRFTFKMLSGGETVVPASGMQQIPEQLVQSLPLNSILYDVSVESITREHGRATGVRTQSGEHIAADTIVVATDPHTAARLIDEEQVPHQPVSCTCVYFAGAVSLYNDRMIVLNANPDPYINNLVQISNVAPAYAPPGQHLLSLTLLDASQQSDEEIEQRCRAELAALFPGKPLTSLRLLRIIRIPFAQFAQPPGIYRTLPANTTALPNVYLASEVTLSSSIEGAMRSGDDAARQILAGVPAPATTA